MNRVYALGPEFQADIDARLAAIEEVCPRSTGSERDRHLLAALQLCGPFRPLPYWLYASLRELLLARMPQGTVHEKRWNLVLALRDESRFTWQDTFQRAQELLTGTPEQGSADAIRKSYELIESKLPPEQRRPRTYRRRD